MSNSINAKINNNGSVTVSNGITAKNISLKDYLGELRNLLDDQDEQDLTGKTFKFPSSIHSMSSNSSGYIINLYYPAREADLTHTTAGTRTVYMPNVMIKVNLRKVSGSEDSYSLGDIFWYATDRERVSLPSEWPSGECTQNHIWTLPLPNIFSGATMCTGHNVLPSVVYNDWTVLDMLYYDVLLGSPFNNDLSLRSVSGGHSPGGWITYLGDWHDREDTDSFPYHELINY